MKSYRMTTVYLTDILLLMSTVTIITAVVVYSSLQDKTDKRVLELEGKVKVLEKVFEKKWLDKLNEKLPKKYKKVI